MMKHIKAIVLKGIFAVAILYLFAGLIYQLSFTKVAQLTVILTVIGYLIDMALLPGKTNKSTGWLDCIFFTIVSWMLIFLASDGHVHPLAGAIPAGLILAWLDGTFLHAYVRKYVIRNGKDQYYNVIFLDQFRTKIAGDLPVRGPHKDS
ncbi:DUF2512 family protein [Terribacillus sp. 7520-G]|uniref:DUF2512 family protein n=1 Tax=Terribacillus TaxID=459532 RepID=UPI000BA5DC37|nr:DUF2512 family protein [Terribacillus sp. 7520-G]PAD38697.1 hypothetical protein CHH53_09515 [Terribacillus sp. 7520-G]